MICKFACSIMERILCSPKNICHEPNFNDGRKYLEGFSVVEEGNICLVRKSALGWAKPSSSQ
ncbi:hypothetical protein BDE02_14G143800 [Populus trichocarpa]|nr:hypothetical protein BDE02_14G143800 [Populus trichocarpa]